MRRFTGAVALCLAALAAPLAAQNMDPIQQRQKLDSLRNEREKLEAAQKKIQGQVVSAEALKRNYEARRAATNAVVNVIEQQIRGLSSQLERSAAELALAQDNLTERKAVLNRRLADIYRRGPLRTFQVLLAAESFGDLVARYKYLYLTSRQDRALVEDVQKLASQIAGQRGNILSIESDLTRKRMDREAEMEHYADMADEQANRMKTLNRTAAQNTARLTAMEKDEAKIRELIDTYLKAGKTNPARSTMPAAGKLSTADIGSLDWPVEGELVQRFGVDTVKGGGVVPSHGISIAAPVGTPVKAIAAGRVVTIATLPSYGLTVIIAHGDDYLSLYTWLKSTTVKAGQEVARGTVVGAVGGAGTPLGPHLYFEIRSAAQITLDPITWLRNRR